jgi:hypothetical protein
MERLIAKNPRNAERIFPYIGGEEVNTSPTHAHHRYVINFEDFPLERADLGVLWAEADEQRRRECLREGVVPFDYPEPVPADWPDLLAIVRERVKPQRDRDNREAYKRYWWRYAERRGALAAATAPLDRVLACCQTSNHIGIVYLPAHQIFSHKIVVFSDDNSSGLCVLQGRPHEVWARFCGSSLKDDFVYTPSDCFETFPFPPEFEADPTLESVGEAYYRFRAELMVARDKGLTRTYNLFHDRLCRDQDIRRLRELHAEMDRAVLRAYRWDDLAEQAEAVFLDESNEDEFAYQDRLFWPSEFRDEVLARLLALNAERHTAELRAGLAIANAAPPHDEDEDRDEEDDAA